MTPNLVVRFGVLAVPLGLWMTPLLAVGMVVRVTPLVCLLGQMLAVCWGACVSKTLMWLSECWDGPKSGHSFGYFDEPVTQRLAIGPFGCLDELFSGCPFGCFVSHKWLSVC